MIFLEKCNEKMLNGVYMEISERLGTDVAIEIHKMFKGQQISFPLRLFNRDIIHEKIRAEYDGTNIRMLAAKYDYSEKSIRRILKEK